MVSITSSDLHLLGDSTREERVLEQAGDIPALQRFRWNVCLEGDKPLSAGPVDLAGLLQTELLIRENDQREVAIKERIRASKKAFGSNEYRASMIENLLDEKIELRKVYWILERRWWDVWSSFPECPLSRGVKLWRSHPKWYMHQWLRDDCSGKGGCCGRYCGCCTKRHNRPGRNLAVGHCTVECHCCEKARGFELDAKHALQTREAPCFDQDYQINSVYANRMIQIATLGLMNGSFDTPVDLISSGIDGAVMPPKYSPPLRTNTKAKVGKMLDVDSETSIRDCLIRYDLNNSIDRQPTSNPVHVIIDRCLLLFGLISLILMVWSCMYSFYLGCSCLLWVSTGIILVWEILQSRSQTSM